MICACAISVAAIALWLIPRPISAAENPAIERHRNLGKAFFENPTTHVEAIAEFNKALEIVPGHHEVLKVLEQLQNIKKSEVNA